MSKTTLVLIGALAVTLSLVIWMLVKIGLVSFSTQQPDQPQQPARMQLEQMAEIPPLTLQWPDLIPSGYNPDDIYLEAQRQYNIDELQDNDPRVVEVMKKMEALAKASPIKPDLNGKRVRLPGYVVPLETDGKQATEFLLVPYFGACIHMPPPPSNQTVHVTTLDPLGARISKLFEIVWVTGVIKTEKYSSDLADAGYVISATDVEPYEDEPAVNPGTP